MDRLFRSLRTRRKPLALLLAYLAASWLVLQLLDALLGNDGLPGWAASASLLVLGIGLVAITTIVFRQLTREEIREIVDLLLRRVKDQLAGQEMELVVTDAAKDAIIVAGYDQAFGARPLRREIQNQIEDALAERLSTVLGASCVFTGVERLTGGASRETWSLTTKPDPAVPRELIYLDQLPWLPNGKPDRVAIRSLILNLRAERQATA